MTVLTVSRAATHDGAQTFFPPPGGRSCDGQHVLLASASRIGYGAACLAFVVSCSALALGGAEGRGVAVTLLRMRGPFPDESAGTRALRVRFDRNALLLRALPAPGSTSFDYISVLPLKLLINGTDVGLGDRTLESIRKRGAGRSTFSGDGIVFSLPEGVTNGPDTWLSLEYTLQLTPVGTRIAWVSVAFSGMLVGLLTWRTRYDRRLLDLTRQQVSGSLAWARGAAHPIAGPLFAWASSVRMSATAGRTSLVACTALLGLVVLAAAAGVAYLLTIAYGFAEGYALPNTAVFDVAPRLRELAKAQRSFAYGYILFGAVGWLLSVLAMPDARRMAVEHAIARAWRWSTPVVILATYMFSLAGPWAGVSRAGEYGAVAIAGLVPFSDACGHFAGPLHQVVTGSFDPWALRRPTAAATRSGFALMAQYSAVGVLMLQGAVLALSTTLAVWSVARWRGIWASITFLGLTYNFARPYASMYLTEALGISWALAGVPFIVNALRSAALPAGLGFLLTTCQSLLVRLGSLFTIPAIVAWLLWSHGTGRAALLRVFALVALVLAGCWGLNAAIAARYGGSGGTTGSNFAYTLCGLAHGAGWSTCEALYASELAGAASEADASLIRIAKARAVFLARPELMLGRLAEGEAYFLGHVLRVLTHGYDSGDHLKLPPPAWFPERLWLAAAIMGAFWTLLRNPGRHERSFWLMMAAGVLMSAPWVIFDEGWRVLSGSFPLLALFAASGFSSRLPDPAGTSRLAAECAGYLPRSRASGGAVALLGTATWLLLVVPGVAHRIDRLQSRSLQGLPLGPGQNWIFGSRVAAGLLVVPDDQAPPRDVPAMRFSDFKAALDGSGVETYERVLYPELGQREFGFVYSIGSLTGPIFVTPAEVLRRSDVVAWRLTLDASSPPPERYEKNAAAPGGVRLVPLSARQYFAYVSRAEPALLRAP